MRRLPAPATPVPLLAEVPAAVPTVPKPIPKAGRADVVNVSMAVIPAVGRVPNGQDGPATVLLGPAIRVLNVAHTTRTGAAAARDGSNGSVACKLERGVALTRGRAPAKAAGCARLGARATEAVVATGLAAGHALPLPRPRRAEACATFFGLVVAGALQVAPTKPTPLAAGLRAPTVALRRRWPAVGLTSPRSPGASAVVWTVL